MQASGDWIDLSRDAETGIETIRAHFNGHAYDPHWHDSYLIGVTEQGVQQFNCRRQKHSSTPGKVFLLEPGEIHDGNAPNEAGFTYQMLYLQPQWLEGELNLLFEDTPSSYRISFESTLASDARLAQATLDAFQMLHQDEFSMVRQAAIDTLLHQMTRHTQWRKKQDQELRISWVAQRARDYLHAHLQQDIGLKDLVSVTGVDRFRLTRAFKAAFGMAPHTYLVQLRLTKARQLLAQGCTPKQVAADLCFADQSHLGRWFRRAYRLTPGHYRKFCINPSG